MQMLQTHDSSDVRKTPVDTSKEAIARRATLREFSLQDRALALSRGGASNKAIGVELEIGTDEARTLVSVARGRNEEMASIVPHPDIDSLELTKPELVLLRSLLEVHVEHWKTRATRSPETKWVSRRVGKSKSWAISCARRRIGHDHYSEASPLSLVFCSGNGYLWLTPLGWSAATTLFPDVVP
jgi:hypothetical protein